MAFNEQEETKVRELLAAFENGKRISELEPAEGEPEGMRIEVMDASGETRSMELERALAEAGNPIAGRWWDSSLGTTKASGWYGSLEALRNLPATLGLGRYLVTDDRVMRKLDPQDSRKFEDGSPAALDGTMGQCMWCWSRGWYFTRWRDGTKDIWAVTLKPIEGKESYHIPAGGTSWLGVGVMDREEEKLCSVISDEERYRGGGGTALDFDGANRPAATAAQMTMLGMGATETSASKFGEYARKRGEGWEANWYVAQAAVQILITIIMGERRIREAYNPEKDADGLMQGGLGDGVNSFANSSYNGKHPIITTDAGLETGDGTGLVEYSIPAAETSEDQSTPYKTFQVPVFFGLVFAGFGNLERWVRGLAVRVSSETCAEAYVARSMYADFDDTTVEGLARVARLAYPGGYITELSTRGLCMLGTSGSGTGSTYFAGQQKLPYNEDEPIRARAAGGFYDFKYLTGNLFSSNLQYGANSGLPQATAPLCFFKEDPIMDI